MGYVDDHTQAIHFGYYLCTKSAQTIVFRALRIGRGITDVVVLGMAKGNVANPCLIESVDVGQIFADAKAVFKADVSRKPTFLLITVSILRLGGKGDHVAVFFAHTLDGCQIVVGLALRPLVILFRPNPLADENGKELCVQSSRLHARQIELAAAFDAGPVADADIKSGIRHVQRGIAMRVNGQSSCVDEPRFFNYSLIVATSGCRGQKCG